MNRLKFALILLTIIFSLLPVKLSALDPATVSAAAPQAAALAAQWSPHLTSALTSTGQGLLQMGIGLVNTFRLPLGILQCTLGAPFGFFHDGTRNCAQGAMGPCEVVIQALLLPIRIISLGTIR